MSRYSKRKKARRDEREADEMKRLDDLYGKHPWISVFIQENVTIAPYMDGILMCLDAPGKDDQILVSVSWPEFYKIDTNKEIFPEERAADVYDDSMTIDDPLIAFAYQAAGSMEAQDLAEALYEEFEPSDLHPYRVTTMKKLAAIAAKFPNHEI